MTRHTFTLGAVVAAFILSQAPAFGQAGSRPNTTGSSTGTASPRGGETGSSSGSGSSVGSSSAGSSSSGTASSRPVMPAIPGMGGPVARESAPQRPRAVPRGSAGIGSTDVRAEGPRSRMSPAEAGAHAVPTYSRPRNGRTPLGGGAVDRRDAPAPPQAPVVFLPFYGNYGFYGPYGGYSNRYGYGYGFGYDPFFLGGMYYGGYGGGMYYGAPSYSAGGYSSQHAGTGKIRLRVEPVNAEVYVDGYFVGTVDDFDGMFQRLTLDAGPHRIQLRAEGFEAVEFEVFITQGETISYRGALKPQIP